MIRVSAAHIIVGGFLLACLSCEVHGKPYSDALTKRYERPEIKTPYSWCFSDPNRFRELKAEYLNFYHVLPADKSKAKAMLDRLVRVDGILAEHIYHGKEISSADADFLKALYDDSHELVFLKYPAAFVLYLKTDALEYALYYCRNNPKGLEVLAEVHDSNIGRILGEMIAGFWSERAPRAEPRQWPQDYPCSKALASSYVRICVVTLTGSPDMGDARYFLGDSQRDYAKFLFDNFHVLKDSGVGRPLMAGTVAQELFKESRDACRIFVQSQVRADNVQEVQDIRRASPELAKLVKEVCDEQITKYQAMRDMPVEEPNKAAVTVPAKPGPESGTGKK